MFYGSQAWDPLLITAQILTIQCIFYLTFGLALWMLVGELSSSLQSRILAISIHSALCMYGPLYVFCNPKHFHYIQRRKMFPTCWAGPYVSGHLVLDYFFGTDLMSFHNFVGWMAVLATIINILPVSFSILLVVSFLQVVIWLAILSPSWASEIEVAFWQTPESAVQVERAKKCLDFSATVYILHFAAAWICVGFPKAAVWCVLLNPHKSWPSECLQ